MIGTKSLYIFLRGPFSGLIFFFIYREQISGKLKQIYTSSASRVVGVNSSDEVFQYGKGTWFKYDGALKDVAISIDGILWGVNSSDAIFTRQDGWFGGPAFK